MVEMTLVAPCKAALLATIRAELWRWNVVTFAGNLWRDFGIEIEIGLGDLKGSRAVEAGAGHVFSGIWRARCHPG